MKTLSAKTIACVTKFINESNTVGIQAIKASATRSLQERNPNGTQYAIAALELKSIDSIL